MFHRSVLYLLNTPTSNSALSHKRYFWLWPIFKQVNRVIQSMRSSFRSVWLAKQLAHSGQQFSQKSTQVSSPCSLQSTQVAKSIIPLRSVVLMYLIHSGQSRVSNNVFSPLGSDSPLRSVVQSVVHYMQTVQPSHSGQQTNLQTHTNLAEVISSQSQSKVHCTLSSCQYFLQLTTKIKCNTQQPVRGLTDHQSTACIVCKTMVKTMPQALTLISEITQLTQAAYNAKSSQSHGFPSHSFNHSHMCV